MKKKFLSFLIAIFMFIPAIFMSACGGGPKKEDSNKDASTKPQTQYEEMAVIAENIMSTFDFEDEEVQTAKLEEQLFSTSQGADSNLAIHNELVKRLKQGTPYKYPLSKTWFQGMCVSLFSVPIGCGDILRDKFKDNNLYGTVIRLPYETEVLDGDGQPIQNPDGSYQMQTAYQFVVTKSVSDTKRVIYMRDDSVYNGEQSVMRAELVYIDEYNFSFTYTDFGYDEQGNITYVDWCYGDSDKNLVEMYYSNNFNGGYATWFDGIETYEIEPTLEPEVIANANQYLREQIDFVSLKNEVISSTQSHKYEFSREEMDRAAFVYVEKVLEEQEQELGPFAGGVNAGCLYNVDETYTGTTLTLPDYIDSFQAGLRVPNSVTKIIIPDNVKYVKVSQAALDYAEGITNTEPGLGFVPITYEYAKNNLDKLFEKNIPDPDGRSQVIGFTGEILFSDSSELFEKDEKNNLYLKLFDKNSNLKQLLFYANDIQSYVDILQPTKITINTSDYIEVPEVPINFMSYEWAWDQLIYRAEDVDRTTPLQLYEGRYTISEYKSKAIEDGYYFSDAIGVMYICKGFIYVPDPNFVEPDQSTLPFSSYISYDKFKQHLIDEQDIECIKGLRNTINEAVDVSKNLKEVEFITDEQTIMFDFLFKDNNKHSLDKVKITFTKLYQANPGEELYGEDYMVHFGNGKVNVINDLNITTPKGRLSVYGNGGGEKIQIGNLSLNGEHTILCLATMEVAGNTTINLPASFICFRDIGSNTGDWVTFKGDLTIYTNSKISPLSVNYDYDSDYFFDGSYGGYIHTIKSAYYRSINVLGDLNIYSQFTASELAGMEAYFKNHGTGYIDEYDTNYHKFLTYLLSEFTDANVHIGFSAASKNMQEVEDSTYVYKAEVDYDQATFDIKDFFYYSSNASVQVKDSKGTDITNTQAIALNNGDNIFTVTFKDTEGDSEDIVYVFNIYRYASNTVNITINNMSVTMESIVFNSGSDVKIYAPEGYDFKGISYKDGDEVKNMYNYPGSWNESSDYDHNTGVITEYYMFYDLSQDLELVIDLEYKEYGIIYTGRHMDSERNFTFESYYTIQSEALETIPSDIIPGFVATEWYDNEFCQGEPVTSLSFEGKYETIKLWAKVEPIVIDINYAYLDGMTHRFTTLPTKYARIMYNQEFGYWEESISVYVNEIHEYNSTLKGYTTTLYYNENCLSEHETLYTLSFNQLIVNYPNMFTDGYITIYVEEFELKYQFYLVASENWDNWADSGCVIDEQALVGYDDSSDSSYIMNYTVNNDGFTLPTVTKSGYNFVGWKVSLNSPSNLTDGSIITNIPSGSYGSFILIATFEQAA